MKDREKRDLLIINCKACENLFLCRSKEFYVFLPQKPNIIVISKRIVVSSLDVFIWFNRARPVLYDYVWWNLFKSIFWRK